MNDKLFMHLSYFNGLPSQSEAIEQWVLLAFSVQEDFRGRHLRDKDIQECLYKKACLGTPIDLSLIDVREAINKLVKKGLVKRCGKNARYVCLTEQGVAHIEEMHSYTRRLIEEARKEWEGELARELNLGDLAGSHDAETAAFDNLWQQVIEYVQKYYVKFIRLMSKVSREEPADPIIDRNEQIDFMLKIGLVVFESLARKKHTSVHQLSALLAINILLSLRTSLPSDIIPAVRANFDGRRIYIDTNILLAAVGLHEDDDYSSLILEFLLKMQELGFRIFVTDITLGEYRHAIDGAIREVVEKRTTTGLSTSIAQAYARKSQGESPQLFFSKYLEPHERLKGEGLFVDIEEVVIDKRSSSFSPTEQKLKDKLLEAGKTGNVLTHDIFLAFHVINQNKNVKRDTYFHGRSNAYLCTADHALYYLDYQEICSPTCLWFLFGRFIPRVEDYSSLAIGLLNRELVSPFFGYSERALAVFHNVLSIKDDYESDSKKIIAGLLAEAIDQPQLMEELDNSGDREKRFISDVEQLINAHHAAAKKYSYDSELSKLRKYEISEKKKQMRKRVLTLKRTINEQVEKLEFKLKGLEQAYKARPLFWRCMICPFRLHRYELLFINLVYFLLVMLTLIGIFIGSLYAIRNPLWSSLIASEDPITLIKILGTIIGSIVGLITVLLGPAYSHIKNACQRALEACFVQDSEILYSVLTRKKRWLNKLEECAEQLNTDDVVEQ